MKTTWPDQSAAFALLERRLAARRLALLDLRERAVFAALTIVLAGFFYWQARVPLDGWCRAHGRMGGVAWLAVAMLVWGAIGALLAAWRQDALLARVPGGEWLALPVDPARVMRHLLSESRLAAAAVIPFAFVTLVAGAGLVPAWWLGLLAAFFAVAWLEGTRAAAAAVRHLAAARAEHRGLPLAVRLLASARRIARTPRRLHARWRDEAPWRALQRLDLLVTRRATAPRARMGFALALVGVSLSAWLADVPPVQRRALAFAAFLPAAALFGAWSLQRASGDPASALRPLPLSLADTWRARFTTVAWTITAAVLASALLANGLPLAARLGTALAWEGCALAVALLGLHYGLTLAPRTSAAENLYFGWLGVTLMASWMIPFLGWAVLLAGLAHSALRLRRWWRPEVC
ncbi:MAG: hypothetical protein U0704_15040 [Candidatus Eisenbacteria bacterium]